MALGGHLAVGTAVKAVVAVVGVVVVVGGGAWAAGIIGAPSVVGVDNAFGAVNESTTVIESELVVHNPNPFGVELGELTIDYAVEMNGIRMAEGHREGIEIESQGNSTIPFRSQMNNSKLPQWWTTHIENGEQTTLVVDASVHSDLLGQTFKPQVKRTVNTSIISAFNSETDRPIEANKPALSDPVLWLNSTSGAWGAVSNESTEIDMAFELYNPNAYPITITEVGYDIRMNNVTMGEGSTEQTTTIGPGATETLEATTIIDNQNLDEWWVTHLRNNQTTHLVVEFYVKVDLSAAGGGTVRVPLDTFERTIETDMFGNKGTDDANQTTETTPTGSETPAGTETGTDSGMQGTDTPTETPTPTATPTPTPSPTPTDDGVI